jgi:hypothetical protein
MKKIVLISMAILTIMTCYSQTEKGKKFIGGQFNLSGNTNSYLDTLYKYDNNSFGFQIDPGFGFLIINNFAIGCDIKFGISDITQNIEYPSQIHSKSTIKSTSISYGVGGFARYYKKIVDRFFIFVNGDVSYMYQEQKLKYSNNDPNYIYPASNPANQKVQVNNISVVISPGLVYFVTSKLGVQFVFGNIHYTNSTSKNKSLLYDNHNNANNYGININLSTLYLGLNYYF